MNQGLPIHIQSGIPGLVWPPLATPANAQLWAWVQWLDRSQWLSPTALQAGQLAQLAGLLRHFENQSPWFAQRLRETGQSAAGASASMAAFMQLPVASRRDVQQAGESFHARIVPPSHEPKRIKKTSGSTGEPVTVYRTALNQLFWLATTVRDHLWHRRDPMASLAIARQNLPQAFDRNNWGPPISSLFATGTSHGLPLTTDVGELMAWLLRVQPTYLLIYPSVWQTVLQRLPPGPALPKLAQVRTIGETVGPALRQQTLSTLGVPVIDTYSSEEAGVLALQCPQSLPASPVYHTMAEGVVVEIVRGDGTPCQPGETGRVVVTDLLNFASPMIRYDIGDYAELGPVCGCGRGLPTLGRILGRLRNMVKLPGGKTNWPLTGFREFSTIAPVTQYQFIQKSLELIEIRLVIAGAALTPNQETAFAELVSRSLGHVFTYHFVYFAGQLPKPASGKFEEFVCEC